jgi:AcrR family transcriptional regulator
VYTHVKTGFVARPKSEDKRNAILDAATRVFAERGLTAAPTSEMSKQAGVAEGTLFTYFKTKDDLINALYREIKLQLADAMMSGFPRKKSVRTRLRHVWDSYVNWGGDESRTAQGPGPTAGLRDAFERVA